MAILTPVWASLLMAFSMLWETLWPLVFGFALSGAVQAFVSRSEMTRMLGGRGPRQLALAAGLGAASSSCSYAATAMSKSLFQKGADFTAAMVFMFASTNLVLELGLVLWILIGWQFTLSEFVGGIIMIGLLALGSRLALRSDLVEGARRRLREGAAESAVERQEEADVPLPSLLKRLRSRSGWADAASYTIADLTMLRKELLIGYLVAGFLTVLVPDSIWNVVFLRGHGPLTSVENVLVGPFIAMISFVCSVGNVPLAAALWKGGISFGGVVSFIFADLISFPLVLIYRRYYGTAMAIRMVALFWTVMSLAGLATEGIFGIFHLIPTTRPTTVAEVGIHLNYTTYLNLVFIALFGVLYYLHRNRARFGGGEAYAIDPICGMQVQRANAPAVSSGPNGLVYFCSDHCKQRYERSRESNPAAPAPVVQLTDLTTGWRRKDLAIDPVCQMTVDPEDAINWTLDDQTYYFCSSGCVERFAANPKAFLDAKPRAQASGGVVDPVCKMGVDPSGAIIRSVGGRNYFFCSEPCADSFVAEPDKYLEAAAG